MHISIPAKLSNPACSKSFISCGAQVLELLEVKIADSSAQNLHVWGHPCEHRKSNLVGSATLPMRSLFFSSPSHQVHEIRTLFLRFALRQFEHDMATSMLGISDSERPPPAVRAFCCFKPHLAHRATQAV
jgi:hypothetical protein